jgi:DNA-binding NtrC family response regulator
MAIVNPITYPAGEMARPVDRNGMLRIFVVGEDAVISSACCNLAAALGLAANTAPTLRAARDLLRDGALDVLLVDLSTMLEEGLALLDEVEELHPSVGVIVISACGSVAAAVEAMRTRGTEFLPKPFSWKDLTVVLERVVERCAARGPSRHICEPRSTSKGLNNLIGRSPEMDKLHHILPRIAKGSHPVLIMGEIGVGKELVARNIHSNGVYADRRFVVVDCSSLAPTLIASELFGFVREPDRDARRSKKGCLASGPAGTIFLDEIAELPMGLQAQLFRALKEEKVSSMAGAPHIAVNVRVLAATTRDLLAMVQQGRFRKDLYHWLSVVKLQIPSLRERKQDIPLLAAHFLQQMSFKTGTKRTLSDDALRAMVEYEWPGNIGELESSITLACTLSTGSTLHTCDLPTQLQGLYVRSLRETSVASSNISSSELEQMPTRSVPVLPLAELEKRAILNAVSYSKDKISIARELGIGKTTLYRKLKKYGISETGRVMNGCT